MSMSEWILPKKEDVELDEYGHLHIWIEGDDFGNRYISLEGETLEHAKKLLNHTTEELLELDNGKWKKNDYKN